MFEVVKPVVYAHLHVKFYHFYVLLLFVSPHVIQENFEANFDSFVSYIWARKFRNGVLTQSVALKSVRH